MLHTDTVQTRVDEDEGCRSGKEFGLIAHSCGVTDGGEKWEMGFDRDKPVRETIVLPSFDGAVLHYHGRTYRNCFMLIPPIVVNDWKGIRPWHLSGLVNDTQSCKTVQNFFPSYQSRQPLVRSSLYDELSDSGVFHSLWDWKVLDFSTIVWELIRAKIRSDILRSTRIGFKGLSCIRAAETFIRAMLRPCEADSLYVDGVIQDTEPLIYLHPEIANVRLEGNIPVDLCSGTNSPLAIARLKDGVRIKDFRFVGMPVSPYASYRKSIVGLHNDDPHRVIVSRNLASACELVEPDEPLSMTEVSDAIPSVSMPGLRMTHPMTYEDGIVVSETLARKMGAFTQYVDTFVVPTGSECWIIPEVISGNVKDAASKARGGGKAIHSGEVVACLWNNEGEQIVTREVRSSVKVPSVLESVIKQEVEGGVRFELQYCAYLPLRVGDKLTDAHGNKGTVSMICPDSEMPRWNGEICHYIAQPFCMKRMAFGGEVEDILSFVGKSLPEEIPWIESAALSLPELYQEIADMGLAIQGSAVYQGKEFRGVVLSNRRLFRLDNHVEETLSVSTQISESSPKLSVEMITLVTRGSGSLVSMFAGNVSSSLSSDMRNYLSAFEGKTLNGYGMYEVTKRLPDEYARGVFSLPSSFDGTVLDVRASDHFGVIECGRRIIIPPHSGFLTTGNGQYVLSPIAKAANRLIADVQQSKFSDVPLAYSIERYLETLARLLCGKDGLIRNALSLRAKFAIRSVVTPYDTKDPLTVAIPRRAASKLRHNGCPDTTVAILKRDPVHLERHFVGVRVVEWDNLSIGVSPLLIGALNGDYDGDCVTVIFPESKDMADEFVRCMQDPRDLYYPSKYLKDVTYDQAYDMLHSHVGMQSLSFKPHPADIPTDPALADKLINGMSVDALSDEAIRAAKDFALIKQGTAYNGASALHFLFTQSLCDVESLRNGCELYHALTQDTLNAKSGSSSLAMDLQSAVQARDIASVKELMNGIVSVEASDKFCTFLQQTFEFRTIREYLRSMSPVYACLLSDAGVSEIRNLLRSELSMPSFWETLFRSRLGL